MLERSGASLQRTIGFGTCLSITVGGIIGSGIFMRPSEIAALLGSPGLLMLAWIVGGLVTLLFTMSMAEVAAMLPEEGGSYSFMRHMYGDFMAYLYGWACFAVINCAGTAGIAFIFSEYLSSLVPLPSFSPEVERSFSIPLPVIGRLYPLEQIGVKLCTVLLLTGLSIVNYRSTLAGGRLQVVSTFAKVLAIALLTLGIFFSGKGDHSHFYTSSAGIQPTGWALVLAMAAAINGSLQSYDGTSALLNITGEIRDPARNIPRSLIWGLWICIAIYLLVNAGMLYAMGVDEMAGSHLVASDAATHAFGPLGVSLVALLISLSVFGTTNVNVLSPPRLTFAMGRNGHFFRAAGRIHPRFGTPGTAILIHLAMMILMVFTGSFFMLTDMYIFIVWFFNLFLLAGLFILRKKMPDRERPYRAWGYPWIPMLILAGNLVYLVLIVYGDVKDYREGRTPLMNSLAGLAITAMGIPFYFFLGRKR